MKINSMTHQLNSILLEGNVFSIETLVGLPDFKIVTIMNHSNNVINPILILIDISKMRAVECGQLVRVVGRLEVSKSRGVYIVPEHIEVAKK